jgi:hypothetical protein
MWENVDYDKKCTSITCVCILRRFIMYKSYRDELTPFVRRLESTEIDVEFTEFVRQSKNWKDLARRCGYELQFAGGNKWRSALQKKVASLGLDVQHFNCKPRMEQLYKISVSEFKEHVRLSHSWSELARRCGQPTKFGRFCSDSVVSTLKQKVLFLKLDTEHFWKCARAGEAEEAGAGGEVGERGEMGENVCEMGENV